MFHSLAVLRFRVQPSPRGGEGSNWAFAPAGVFVPKWIIPVLASAVLAGCVGRPPVTTGLACHPAVPNCHGPTVGLGGYNDSGLVASDGPRIVTGSLGPVDGDRQSPPASAENPAIEQGSWDDEAAPADLGPSALPPVDQLASDGQILADAPALRLSPLSPAETLPTPTEQPLAEQPGSGAPVDLLRNALLDQSETAAQPPVLQAMASSDELGLRASTSPLTLNPPPAPAATVPTLAEDGATELALADLPDGADVPLPPVREYSDRISVDGNPGTGPRMTLAEVVSRAATMHPEVTLALARVDEARAGVDRARSGLGPQVDVRISAGQEALGSLTPSALQIDTRSGDAAARLDGSLRLRQLLFDFNATRDEVLSTVAASDAARLRTVDVTEDIALRTAQAYLRILQQRQLLALIERSIEEHQRLLEIVELNEADGNSTMADVNRVAARLSEVRSARTDLAADLDGAEDAFERLARVEPGRLVPPEPVVALLAPSADDAVQRALSGNPSLLSLSYNLRSLQHELDVVNGDGGARLDLELEANTKNYFSDNARTEGDVRGMVVFSYNLFDSGNAQGEQREVEARIRQARARYTDSRDQVEADIRQAYRAISSARRKLDDLRSGLRSSREVQSLYTEQFQAGERTIFELLDAQNALYSAERELIVSQFSELEAAYSILRATGRLTSTLLNTAS